MKKVLLGILMIIMCISLIGCGKKDEESNRDSSVNDSQNIDEVNAEKAEKEKYENEMKSIEVNVLASTTIETDDSIILYTVSNEMQKATLITVGIKFPSEDTYYKYFSGLEICGETATDEEGNPAQQNSINTSWLNEDNTYMLAVIRVKGEVDTAKASIKLTGKKDEFEITRAFDNNGKVIGFEEAIEKFVGEDAEMSNVVKLKNRHYIISRYYNSSSGSGHKYSRRTRAYILIPLEDGFERTLTNADVTLKTSEPVENVEGVLKVNRGERLDHTALSKQTTIEIDATRTIVETPEADGDYSKEVYNKIEQDINKFFENSVLEIDDGEGNVVTLSL